MLTELYPQFLTIATLHLFAVMSPGPDFALIIKQTFFHGRKSSIITSLGIGTGILFHIIYCITGLGVVLSSSPYLFKLIKISGGLYLIFIGYKSLLAKATIDLKESGEKLETSNINAFSTGLLTNILNPKATLFFLSLYTFIISEQPIIYIQIFYGAWMSLVTTLWFCCLSIILTNRLITKQIGGFLHVIQNITGIMLIAIGIQLVFLN